MCSMDMSVIWLQCSTSLLKPIFDTAGPNRMKCEIVPFNMLIVAAVISVI